MKKIPISLSIKFSLPKNLLKVSGLAVFCITFLIYVNVLTIAYDTTNSREGKVYTSSKVDTSIPSWFKPMNSDNLNDWLNILPPNLQKYKNASQFVVIPAMGLIAPIVELDQNSSDFKKGIAGKDFDYDKYLIDGPTIYPGTAPIGEVGNTFLFGHSNYWIGKAGNFKTIFRLTYNIEEKDIILVFKKDGITRKKYTYEVTQSRLVDETEISVMMPDKDKKEITLSACWPIGTARQRRINRASLIKEENIDYQINVSSPVTPSIQNNQQLLLQEIQNNQDLSKDIKDALILTYNSYIPGLGSGSSLQYIPQENKIDVPVRKSLECILQALIGVLKSK